MPTGIFHVCAVVGDEIVYSSNKPQIGEIGVIERRAVVLAARKLPEDVDPGKIQVYLLPFMSVAQLKAPRPRPVAATQPAELVKSRGAHHQATHPKQSIRPTLYKDQQQE